VNAADAIVRAAIVRPSAPCGELPADVLEALERHRAAPLAWDGLTTAGLESAWPEELRLRLRRASARRALESELLDAELRRVLQGLQAGGTRAVVIKGAALAYTHYRLPHLRPRGDSDLVIAERDREAAFAALSDLGYGPSDAVAGALITQQAQWTRSVGAGVRHAVDVHWRVFNPHLFGNLLAPGELLQRSVAVPALGPAGRVPHPVDALLLACAHQAAHHAGEADLIWDFDVHLLVNALSQAEAAEAAARIRAANLRAVTAAAVARAAGQFGTRVPSALAAVFDEAASHREPTAAFLQPGRRQIDLLASDLTAVSGWRARARLLREHLFPPAAYMRAKYGLRSVLWLPLAYAHRIVAGVPKWMRSQRS
jgi:hypothetical protein